MLQFLLCATIPVLPGLTFMRLKKNREAISLTGCYMTGLLFCFLLGEIASCVTVKLDGDFTLYCRLLSGMVLGTGLLSLLLNRKLAGELLRCQISLLARKKKKEKKKKADYRECHTDSLADYAVCGIFSVYAGYSRRHCDRNSFDTQADRQHFCP